MKTTCEMIEPILKVWQDILRLRDWDIRIRIVDESWRKSGDIKIDMDDKKAVLMINESPKCTNLTELVVHELIHVKLWGMDQMIESLLSTVYGEQETDPKREFAYTQFMLLLESTTEDLTKAFLAASGSSEPLSFGRLQPQIHQELKQVHENEIKND